MVNVSINVKLLKQLEEINELSRGCENVSNIEIIVSKDVYDKAEKMAKELNTDVEAIFAIAAYRLLARSMTFSLSSSPRSNLFFNSKS